MNHHHSPGMLSPLYFTPPRTAISRGDISMMIRRHLALVDPSRSVEGSTVMKNHRYLINSSDTFDVFFLTFFNVLRPFWGFEANCEKLLADCDEGVRFISTWRI
jgi:hypothetical protein